MNREQADTELKEQCLTQGEPRQTTAPASIAEAGAAVCWSELAERLLQATLMTL
jgi:hypothetical protein